MVYNLYVHPLFCTLSHAQPTNTPQGRHPRLDHPSWLAARYGPFNVTLAMTALTVLTVFVVWVPFGDYSAATLYLVAFFMGVGTGSFVPLAGELPYLGGPPVALTALL